MEIKSRITRKTGATYDVVYRESDPAQNLGGAVLHCIHAFCFYEGKLILVNHPTSGWMPVGGGIEEGETFEETTIREVKEETNMKVLHQELIGYVDVFEPHRIARQTRSFCVVEPYGDFVADPDGEIQEIKLIDPKDYKEYFNWGEIGEHVMDTALEMLEKHNAKNK